MVLRGSEHRGTATFDTVLEVAASSLGDDSDGLRAAFLDLVRRAKEVAAAQAR